MRCLHRQYQWRTFSWSQAIRPMNLMDINWLAVIVAAMVPMAVGSLWYGPLFGKLWLQWMELTEADIREGFNPVQAYGISTLMALIMAFVLAGVIGSGASGAGHGMMLGALMWLGFIVPYGYQSVAFEMKKKQIYFMSMGYNLVVLLIMGLILGAWL